MVLILLSWLYIFFTSLTLGIGFSKLFQLKTLEVVITVILGLFSVTLLASSWAIFGPIAILFHLFLLVTSITLGLYFKSELKQIIKTVVIQLTSFSLTIKLLLVFSSLLILAQSATLPFIVDNETYYIQTIKWLNEYGFVPGLANLHLFFGQTSGWHITQSVYTFSFWYNNCNDLNGFLLLITNFWVFQKLHSFFTHGKHLDLVFGLLPLTYVFLFQFVSAPSPDLPIYLIGFILFSMYLELQQDFKTEQFIIITILVLFAVYIKITAVVLLLLPLFSFIKNAALLKKQIFSLRIFSGLVLLLLVGKNIIITGYPLYPLKTLPCADYAVPKEIMDFFFSREIMNSFYMPYGTFESSSLSWLLKKYFLQNGIDSIIGLSTLILLVISPFIMSKFYPKQRVSDIYFVFITLLILLVFSSPQYRFYVYFTIFFGLIFLSILLTKKKFIIGLLSLSLLSAFNLFFVPMSYSKITHNKLLANNSKFDFENTLYPKSITKEEQVYTQITIGNLDYYSPNLTELFWITGNGNLPTINQKQLDYFENNFHFIPQLRGKTLGEGFYAQKTKIND
jgi:hypothetical protein